MSSAKRNVRRCAVVVAALCIVYLVVAGVRNAGRVESRNSRSPRATCPLNHTLIREQWKQCEYSVRYRHVLIHGRDAVMVAADSPDYERINVALFDVARRAHVGCERRDIPTFLVPAKRFVPHALRLCEAALALPPNASSRPIPVDTTDHFLSAAPRQVTLQTVVPEESAAPTIFVVLYVASNYSGHSLELLLDSVGGTIAVLSRGGLSARAGVGERTVTFVVHDYEAVHHSFAAQYLSLLQEALAGRSTAPLAMALHGARFLTLPLFSPAWFRLRAVDSLLYVAPMFDETPCQQVAQQAWCTLCSNTQGPFTSVLVILKRDQTLHHHTPNFFSVSDEDVSSKVMNVRFLSERASKKTRLLHLNHARTLVDSFGANAHINRLLLLPASLILQRWITLIHPNASDRILDAYCNITVTRTNGIRREFLCVESAHIGLKWFRDHL